MKIGIFSETYRPTINGVVVSIETFRTELEKRGHEYFIFAPHNRNDDKQLENVFRFPSIDLPNQPFYPLARPMPFSLAKWHFPIEIIRQLDLIHIQHFSTMGHYGLKWAQLLDLPVIYTFHTMAELYTGYTPILGPLITHPVRWWTLYTAQQTSQIVAPTQSIKHYLQSIGIKQSINVIPTGIQTNLYKPISSSKVRQKYKIKLEDEILLFVGRLSVEKNVDFLLDAFSKIVQTKPNVHLILAGGGPDKAKFINYCLQHKLNKQVTLTGFLPHKEIIELFGSADLFVFPSTTDTQGIVILEAMAAGTPPVAVDRLGPHDIIKHNLTGCLTDLNLEEFSSTIINLLNNPSKRLKLSIAAKRQAKYFDAKVTADAMEKLYVKTVNQYHEKTSHYSRP